MVMNRFVFNVRPDERIKADIFLLDLDKLLCVHGRCLDFKFATNALGILHKLINFGFFCAVFTEYELNLWKYLDKYTKRMGRYLHFI